MIEFMVIGAPRSGTTWAANWLTTDQTLCLHDPLYHTHYRDWDSISVPGSRVGVSCTGIWRWPEWVNSHPSRKLILHRDLREINLSLREIGLPEVPRVDLSVLEGMHMDYQGLFEEKTAKEAWEYLTGGEFNPYRHRELRSIEMQPHFMGLSVGPEVTRRLREELEGI